MSESNIERFDEITGKIFAHLYQHFPVPTHLEPEIAGVTMQKRVSDPVTEEGYGGVQDLTEIERETVDFFVHSAKWLAKAGYIDILISSSTGFIDVTLTAKGLEVLKATPKSLENSETLGQQLIAATKGGFADQIRDLTTSVLKRGVALAVTTASELAGS